MFNKIKEFVKRSFIGPCVFRVYLRLHRKFYGYPESKDSIYNKQTIAVMRRVLRPDSSCVDIGANQGEVLMEMQKFSRKGMHTAIEPLPHLASRLKNKFPRVRVFECALSSHPGSATFNYVVNSEPLSGLRPRKYDRTDLVIKPIHVDVRTLDDVIPHERKIKFLKIDCEGAEYEILQGGRRVIGDSKPYIVFEAGADSTGYYGVTPTMMYDLIVADYGYCLSTMDRWLRGAEPFSSEEFGANWGGGIDSDYYFLAYPSREACAKV